MGRPKRRSVSNTKSVAKKTDENKLAHDGASHCLTWHRPATQGGRPAAPGSTTTCRPLMSHFHLYTSSKAKSRPMPRLGHTASRSTPYTPLRPACIPPSWSSPWHGVCLLTDPPRETWNKGEASPAHVQNRGTPQRTAGQFPVPPSHAKLRVPIFHFTTARHAHCPSSSLHSSLTLLCSTSQPKCTLLGPSPWLVDSAAKPVVRLWNTTIFFSCSSSSARLNSLIAPGVRTAKNKKFHHSAGRILPIATQKIHRQSAKKKIWGDILQISTACPPTPRVCCSSSADAQSKE
ncbi:hypothetical protein V8C35DRAFT_258926 [Trichoderma chlorosporum]